MKRANRRTLVKICGLTRPEDAVLAADLGADFVGIVLHPSSPRFVDLTRAREVARAARRRRTECRVVGVFVDREAEEINEIADDVGLDLVQLHGSEEEGIITQIRRPVIKAIRIGLELPGGAQWNGVEWMLFDTFSATSAGGTGRAFDWSLLEGARPRAKFLLSGGLRLENITEALRRVAPDAIDLSSGVEESPGVKSREKIEQLLEAVRMSDAAAPTEGERS